MPVRCAECDHENLPKHTFCGMCGAKLPSRRRQEREREEAQAFSRPSLLGLAEVDPPEAERVDYLLEHERETHLGRWAAVLVLAAVLAGLGWHWRAELRGWTSLSAKTPETTQTPDASTVSPVTASPETMSTSTPSTAQQAPGNDSATQSAATPAASEPSDRTAVPSTEALTDATERDSSHQQEPSPAAAKPSLKPAATKVEFKAATKNESAEALEAQGEDYLYGHGVQADCGLAGKSLLAAAHSSAKAQSVLGTMYATGHCVTRDVPAAYRWFAKASHQEPGNVRIQRDLEVLWQQMTPEEREVATKTEP